jgi:hypothetical protein
MSLSSPSPSVEKQRNTEYLNSQQLSEVRESHEKFKEKGPLDKVKTMVADSFSKIITGVEEDYKKKDYKSLAVKGALGLGALWLTSKAVQTTWNGFKGIFDWTKEKITNNSKETESSIVSSLLKMALPAGALAGVVGLVKNSDLSIVKIMSLASQPLELAKYIAEEVKKGGVKIGADLMKWVNKTLGTSVKESAEQGLDSLGISFNKRKSEVLQFFKDKKIDVPDWLNTLQFSEIRGFLGIEKGASASMYLQTAAGFAGGLFLMLRSKGFLHAGVLTSGLYYYFTQTGDNNTKTTVEVLGLESLKNGKASLLERAGKLPEPIPTIVNESLSDNRMLTSFIEKIMSFAKDNPFMASGAITATWYLKGLLWMIIKNAGKGGWKYLKFAANNKMLMAFVGIVAMTNRRKILNSIADLVFNPGDKDYEEFMKQGRDFLLLDKDPSYNEELGNSYIESLIAAPKELLKKINRGEIALSFDDKTGAVLHFSSTIIQAASLPWQALKLSGNSLMSVSHIFESNNNDGYFYPLIIGGVTTMIFGSAAWEGAKAYKIAVIDSRGSAGNALWKFFKVLTPRTKEWNFVVNSVLTKPIMPVLKAFRAKGIGVIDSHLKQIELEITKSSPSYDKIKDSAEAIKKQSKAFSTATKSLDNGSFLKNNAFYYKLSEKLGNLETFAGDISKNADAKNINEIKHNLENSEKLTKNFKTKLSSFIQRVDTFFETGLAQGVEKVKTYHLNNNTITEKVEHAKKKVSDMQNNLNNNKIALIDKLKNINTKIADLRLNAQLNSGLIMGLLKKKTTIKNALNSIDNVLPKFKIPEFKGKGVARLVLITSTLIGGAAYAQGAHERENINTDDILKGKNSSQKVSSQTESQKTKENIDINLQLVIHDFQEFNEQKHYKKIKDITQPQYIKDHSDESLKPDIENIIQGHVKSIESLKKYLKQNQELIHKYFESHESDQKKEFYINEFIRVRYDDDKKQSYLQSSNDDDMRKALWQQVEGVRSNADEIIALEKTQEEVQGIFVDIQEQGSYKQRQTYIQSLKSKDYSKTTEQFINEFQEWDSDKQTKENIQTFVQEFFKENIKLSMSVSEGAKAAGYLVPGVGTAMDATDTWKAIERGDIDTALTSGAWTILGGVSDALLFTGLLTPVGFALKGTRAAKALGKVGIVANKHMGKIFLGAMGADLGKQFLLAPQSETDYFDNTKDQEKALENPLSSKLFDIAKILGYTGNLEIDSLRSFYSEDKASENGIYWDDGSWKINRDYEWDTSFDSILELKSLVDEIDMDDDKLKKIKAALK